MNLNDFYAYTNEKDTSEKRKLFNKFVKINLLSVLEDKKIVSIELDNPNYNKDDVNNLLLQCLNSDLNGRISGESIFISTKFFNDDDFYIKDDSGEIVLSVDNDAENISYMKNKNPFKDEKDFADFQLIVNWLREEVSNILVFS